MIKVSQEEFYKAVKRAGDEGFDPMPNSHDNNWRCNKTRRIFGKTKAINSWSNENEYFLIENWSCYNV